MPYGPMGHFVAVLACLACAPWAAHGEGTQPAPQTVTQAQVDPETVRFGVTEGQDLRFVRRLRSQGLSQQRVTDIVQDDQGFLWFGTQYGLDRYDGYSFRVFKNDPDNSRSLCGVKIPSLFKDRTGALWIGCDYSLDRYDPTTETFVHYPLETPRSPNTGGVVRHISQDRGGMLWLSTANGLYRLDPGSGRVTRFNHSDTDPFSLSSNDVKSSGEDRSGSFWVATGEGLDAFDRKRGRITLHVPLREPRDFSFYEDRSGVFWLLYASGNGLAILDRNARRLTRYSFTTRDLPGFPLTGVSSMLEDRDGTLWVGTFSDGLLKLDREHHRFTRYRNDPANDESLPENRVTTLFQDREGNVWSGFGATEPAFFSRPPPPFDKLPFDSSNSANLGETLVNVLYEDREGMLWIGTTGALNRLDRSSGRYTHFEVPGNGIASDVLSIVEDQSGALWVGTSGQGLYRLEPATGRLRAVQHIEFDASRPSIDTVTRLLFDREERLWLTTLDGLYRFDPATERFTNYRRTVNDAPASYEPIDEDERGALWLAAYGTGVLRLDPASGQFTTFSHGLASSGNYRLNTLHVDHTGAVWVGRQNGLDRFEPLTDTVTQFSEKDGLASNAVSCILEDAGGDLWMGTSKGLSRLDVRRRTFKNYGQADGLPGPDLTGWSACFRSPDGEMYFGGFAGAVAFRPENVTDSSYIPPVVLTAFQLSGATVAAGGGSPLSRSIDYTNALRLSHRDTFSFEFSALSFRSPETNRYRYKLEGLDQAWHEVGSDQRIATYTTLAAGAYRFRVQGATGRGSWSEPGRTVSVTIEPPWWGTWWFRALVGVVTVLLVLAIYFARIRQIARQFEIRLDERLTERLRIARDLHDTLLQRFHGVLLRFQTVYEMLPSRPAEAKESLGGAIDGAAEAITEGRDAVQGLRVSTVEDQDLADAIKALGEELAGSANERESAPLRVDVQGSPRSLRPIVRDEIYRIAAEALRNAFRHAEAKQIEVELWYEQQWLRLRVRDNGKGIDPKFLGKEGHTGHYGLPGMRERATLMGAKFTVWTEPDSGTEVELSIPASRAYAAPSSGGRSWLGERLFGKETRLGS
jgi:signal transduction histidine kinase/ligand-binding sensor domain-containing protein